jgi:hypothetical protein
MSEAVVEGAVTVPPGVVAHEEGAAPIHVAAPQITRPDLDACPKCNVGLLYVIAYDADAQHEQQNPVFNPKHYSGGSASRYCFNCGHGDTVALNPSPAPADPLAGRV